MSPARTAGLHYRIEAADLHAHLFRVTLTIEQPEAAQRVSLPVWIAGSYLVREFSKNLQKLSARQDGRAVPVQQLDKCSWHIDCMASSPLVIAYEVYAFDNSVRTAWLDTQRGFFNGTSLCLKVHGQESSPHALELVVINLVDNALKYAKEGGEISVDESEIAEAQWFGPGDELPRTPPMGLSIAGHLINAHLPKAA